MVITASAIFALLRKHSPDANKIEKPFEISLDGGGSPAAVNLSSNSAKGDQIQNPPAKVEMQNSWTFQATHDEMWNSDTVTFTSSADDTLNNSLGYTTHPQLRITCTRGQVTGVKFDLHDVQVVDHDNGQGLTTVLSYKLDDDNPNVVIWPDTSDFQGSIIEVEQPLPFVEQLAGKRSLLLQVKVYRIGPANVSFNLSGFPKAHSDAGNPCGSL